MHGIRDVEGLLERRQAGTAASLASPASDGREEGRVERHVVLLSEAGGFVCGRRWRCGGGGFVAPWVGEELVDGVSFGGVDAKEMSDEVLGWDASQFHL